MDELARRRRPRRHAGRTFKRDFAVLAGFDPTASVMTDEGPTPLEWIGTGDRVLTKGGTYEPVLWVERSRLHMGAIRDLPELAPVRIERGTLEEDVPDRHMFVSPSQLLFVHRDPADPTSDGVLVPACTVGEQVDPALRPAAEQITYVSLLLPAHHVMQVDGAWMGSLFLADLALELGPDDPFRGSLSADVMEPAAPILGRQEALQFLATRSANAAGRTA